MAIINFLERKDIRQEGVVRKTIKAILPLKMCPQTKKFKIHEEKPLGPFSEQGELMLHTATGDSCCHRDRVEVDLGLCSGLG